MSPHTLNTYPQRPQWSNAPSAATAPGLAAPPERSVASFCAVRSAPVCDDPRPFDRAAGNMVAEMIKNGQIVPSEVTVGARGAALARRAASSPLVLPLLAPPRP